MNIEQYIRRRVEQLTSPVNFQYGYESYEGVEAKLTELAQVAYDWGGWELSEEVKRARTPIRKRINEIRKYKIFTDVD